jgi:hypothetical protein
LKVVGVPLCVFRAASSENVLKLIPPRPAGYDYKQSYLIVEPVFHLIRLQQPKPRQIFHCPFI